MTASLAAEETSLIRSNGRGVCTGQYCLRAVDGLTSALASALRAQLIRSVRRRCTIHEPTTNPIKHLDTAQRPTDITVLHYRVLELLEPAHQERPIAYAGLKGSVMVAAAVLSPRLIIHMLAGA